MRKPNKPRLVVKSFEGLIWKGGLLYRKTIDDILREVYTPVAITQLLPDSNDLFAKLMRFRG